jgi:hypothetical protein
VHVHYASIATNVFPYNNIHIQSCDIVSPITPRITGSKRQSDEERGAAPPTRHRSQPPPTGVGWKRLVMWPSQPEHSLLPTTL